MYKNNTYNLRDLVFGLGLCATMNKNFTNKLEEYKDGVNILSRNPNLKYTKIALPHKYKD